MSERLGRYVVVATATLNRPGARHFIMLGVATTCPHFDLADAVEEARERNAKLATWAEPGRVEYRVYELAEADPQ